MSTIAALQKSDKIAFDEVYRLYHRRIYYYVLGKTNSTYIAEEATQLAFIKLWQYRGSLSQEHSLFTQLFTMATTSMIDMIRKEKHVRESTDNAGRESVAASDTWEELKGRELGRSIDELVRRMPEMRRKVFEMSRYRGMTYREIAEELSLSVKTIESHMMQAIRQLRAFLGMGTILLVGVLRFFF